jgi:hypothetical protein
MLLTEKWDAILNHKDLDPIKDAYKRKVTAILLENQEKAFGENRQILAETAPANSDGSFADTGGIAKWDPVLISMVRRAAPQMIAFDVCGVQPMTQPTGLIFALKSRYTTQGGTEALFNEADTKFSGDAGGASHAGSNPAPNGGSSPYTTGVGMAVNTGEGLNPFPEMAFSIEKTSVSANTRALAAQYSIELAQDLKAIQGLDAEAELINILSSEILFEINREVIRTLYVAAKVGAQTTTTPGTFDLDTDSNGRWSLEKFKGLVFQIERDANRIAQLTRRGRGNFIICSSDVASALAMTDKLAYAPALDANLVVDEASTTFAGILNGKFKVFVDPYSANGGANPQFCMVGYRGKSPWDAGAFYCPYVPLQLVRAVDPNTFQPKLGFKVRYGFTPNPFTTLDSGGGNTGFTANKNYYYRIFSVTNVL